MERNEENTLSIFLGLKDENGKLDLIVIEPEAFDHTEGMTGEETKYSGQSNNTARACIAQQCYLL